jgi:hypothetical protein
MIVCGPEKDACPQDMLTRKTVAVSSLLDGDKKFRSDIGPRVQKQGPESLRGLFWLTEQKDSSSLVSFARSNDGGNMGQGELRQGRYAFSVRVGGDRSWSFADNKFGGNFESVELVDLVYHFKLKSGSLQNPTAFSIIPEARNLGAKLEGNLGEWLLSFDMVKMTAEDAAAAGYSGSIVWDRISSAFGQDVDSARYLAVQVADGDSNPIQPAYDQWLAYMASSAAGGSPGEIHYREALTTDGSLRTVSEDLIGHI